MKQKAQVTLFIVMGIFAVLILGLLIVYVKGIHINKPREQENIQYNIELNLKKSLSHCLTEAGLQGGYCEPKNYLSRPYSNIEYAYNGKNTFLSPDILKTEIENCINKSMKRCINDFNVFKKMGLTIEYGDIKPEVVLGEKHVSAKIDFKVKIISADSTEELNSFITEATVELRSLHNITNTITDSKKEQIENSDIDLSYLGSIAIDTSVYEEDNMNQIYSLETNIGNNAYYFLFSNYFKN